MHTPSLPRWLSKCALAMLLCALFGCAARGLAQAGAAVPQAGLARALGWGWASLCALACVGLGFACHRWWQRPREEPKERTLPHLTDVTAPAELSALMRLTGGVGPRDLVAMLLHLIHRNHLALMPPPPGLPLDEAAMDQARLFRRPAPRETLQDAEFFLMHWLIDLVGDGQSVSLAELRQAGTSADYQVWRRLVRRQILRRPWYEDARRLRALLLAAGGGMVLGTLLCARLGASSAAWLGLAPGTVALAGGACLRKRTPQAQQQVRHWHALLRQLQFGAVPDATTIAQWERVLLYAQAMGVGGQAAQAAQAQLLAATDGMPWPDAREATFLAWPLLEHPTELARWFTLFCQAVIGVA